MLYYMELDKDKEFLEIHEVKNLDHLSRELKIAWGDLNYYLNGDDHPVEILPCGVKMPFVMKSGKLYMISYYDKIINGLNYSYMSRKVYNDVDFMNEFRTIRPTSNKGKAKEVKEKSNKVSTDIIIDCKPSYKSRYSNVLDKDDDDDEEN